MLSSESVGVMYDVLFSDSSREKEFPIIKPGTLVFRHRPLSLKSDIIAVLFIHVN